MKIDDFTRQGSAWHKTTPLKTPYGDFDVQLIGGKPDAEMLNMATDASE